MRNKIIFLMAGLVLLSLALANFASASICCFNPSDGLCTPNSEESACAGGEPFSAASCAGISQCIEGCCIMADSGAMATQAECNIMLENNGLEVTAENWVQATAEQCNAISHAREFGACVTGDYPPYDCQIKTYQECPSERFTFGASCTNSSLQTRCNSTSRTMCWPTAQGNETGDVYTKDTCGQPDQKVSDCDFNSGTICKTESITSAYCKSVDCQVDMVDSKGGVSRVTKKNGESWCSLDSITKLDSEKPFEMMSFYKSSNINKVFVGSRFFRHFCLNGEEHIEPCEDKKGEICQQTGSAAACVKNDYEQCYDVAMSKDSANPGACPSPNCIYTANDPPCGVVDASSSADTQKKAVGIVNENPNNFDPSVYLNADKTGLASGATVAFCNIGTEIANLEEHPEVAGAKVETTRTVIPGASEDPRRQDEQVTIETTTVNLQVGAEFYPVMHEELFAKRDSSGTGGLGVCTALIAPGYTFWGSSGYSGSSSPGYCSSGDFHAEVKFEKTSGTHKEGDFWYMVKDDTDSYGWAGLFDMNPSHWSDTWVWYEASLLGKNEPYGGMPREECDKRRASNSQYICEIESDRLYFYGNVWKNINPLETAFKNLDAESSVKIPLNPYIVDWLGKRCSGWLGDCDGKGNWAREKGTGKAEGDWEKNTENSASLDSENFESSPSGKFTIGDGTNCGQYNNQLSTPSASGQLGLMKNCIAQPEGNVNGVQITRCECDLYLQTAAAAAASASANSGYYIDCKKDGDTVSCPIAFTCSAWSAPEGGKNCGECGADGLACTDYRCRALGKACELKTPDGADKAYCITSDDKSAPQVTSSSFSPSSPVEPWTPVTFTLTTSEDAFCKFNMGSAGGSFSEMQYDFSKEFGTSHTLVLYLPGGRKDLAILANQFPLISGGGNYSMFIRCEDAAGNAPDGPSTVINFDVMTTPEYVPPVPSNFTPASGSAITFNTTEKEIRFSINEPAECRWSFENKDYDLMENNFSCATAVSEYNVRNSWSCRGILSSITTALGNQTRFYIRCKDHPELEGNEDEYYKRNKNDYSAEYLLRPSSELKITELSPNGNLIRGGANASLDLVAITTGGAFNGYATCKWKAGTDSNFTSTPLVTFQTTNSNLHRHPLSNLTEGTYYTYAQCNDSAGNRVNMSSSFNLMFDKSGPLIQRIFGFTHEIRITTDESSSCYVSFNRTLGCYYNTANSTIMSGFARVHSALWNDDEMYYIKCRDFFGNENPGCLTARTY